MKNRQQLIEAVEIGLRKLAKSYLEKNHRLISMHPLYYTDGAVDHITNMLHSMLLHKFGVAQYEAGGFVESVLDNNLKGAFQSADNINQMAMLFYVVALDNIGSNHMNKELFESLRELQEMNKEPQIQ